jgi:hypothetical protein
VPVFLQKTRKNQSCAYGPQSKGNMVNLLRTHSPLCGRERAQRIKTSNSLSNDTKKSADALSTRRHYFLRYLKPEFFANASHVLSAEQLRFSLVRSSMVRFSMVRFSMEQDPSE